MSITTTYEERNSMRQQILDEATMNFVKYFMEKGNDKATAQNMVSQVSTDVAQWLFPFVLGNKQPLIDGLNNCALSFMDAEAKAKIISDLSV